MKAHRTSSFNVSIPSSISDVQICYYVHAPCLLDLVPRISYPCYHVDDSHLKLAVAEEKHGVNIEVAVSRNGLLYGKVLCHTSTGSLIPNATYEPQKTKL
jgi:hypothetical protein